MAENLVENILGRLGFEYDASGFKKFLNDSKEAIGTLKKLAVSYQAVNKAQQASVAKEQIAESRKLTIEGKKLTLTSKELTIAKKKDALASQQLTIAGKKLTNEAKALRLEQQKLKAQNYQDTLKKQDKAAQGLVGSLDNVKDSLLALGVVTVATGLFKIALNVEKALKRIKLFVGDAAFNRIEKRFERLNKSSGDLFSRKDLRESAASVFEIDRNTRRFMRSMEFAIKLGPRLGKTLQEVQEGVARGVIFGEEDALVELGLTTPLALEEMRRRTGLSLGDLKVREREAFVFNLIRKLTKQIDGTDDSTGKLTRSWDRFNKLLDDSSDILSETFAPAAAFLLNTLTSFLRMVAASPFGRFTLKTGAIIAAVAGITVVVGALAKVMVFLQLTSLKTAGAMLLVFGKVLAIFLALGLALLAAEDIFVTFFGPEDADTLTKRFLKWLGDMLEKGRNKVNDFFNDIGFDALTAKIDKFLDDQSAKVLKLANFIKDKLGDIGITFGEVGAGLRPGGSGLFPQVGRISDGQAQPGNQFLNQLSNLFPSSTSSNVDRSTNITIGGNTQSFPQGLSKRETINIATDAFKRGLEKELIEADIRGR